MSKYIDAEKLIAEISRIVEEETPISNGSDYYHGVADTADKLLSFITSLKQEQPEVDLEKEMDRWLDEEPHTVRATARHFYELGLKARKEE